MTAFNFRKLSDALAHIAESEEDDNGEIYFDGYQTKHFDMCPSATELYSSLDLNNMAEQEKDIATRSVKLQDTLFYLEKMAEDLPVIEDTFIDMMQNIEDQIMEMAKMLDLEKEHDYLPSHIDAVKQLQKEKE